MNRIEELIEKLASPSLQDRIAAAEALGQLGPEAAAAVPTLKDRVRYADGREESEAMMLAISRIDQREIIHAMFLRSVWQEVSSAREWARTVGESQAREKLRDLLWAWEDDTPDLEQAEPVREVVAQLVEDPECLRDFVDDALKESLPPEAVATILYLAGRSLPEAKEILRALQNHPDVELAAAAERLTHRTEAEDGLTEEGNQLLALAEEHPTVIPDLIDALRNRPRLRRRLSLVLNFVLYDRPEVADQVIPLLYDRDVEVIQEAVSALDTVKVGGPRAQALVGALLSLFDRTERGHLRLEGLESLFSSLQTGPGGPVVVEMLVAAIRANPEWHALYRLLAYMVYESPTGHARTALLGLMANGDQQIRSGALCAGGYLDAEDVTRVVLDALRETDPLVRRAAAGAMTRWGRDRLAATRGLIMPFLKDDAPGVGEAIAYCLGKLGPEAAEALPVLHARLAAAQEVLSRVAADDDRREQAKKSIATFKEAIRKIASPPRKGRRSAG
jgi:HEAT repeat protein